MQITISLDEYVARMKAKERLPQDFVVELTPSNDFMD